jgi:hypothetical protein
MPTLHIEDEVLERYSIGSLPEELAAEVEEHLLLCLMCQNRLLETDRFLMLLREAATRLSAQPSTERERWSSFRCGSWAVAAGFLLAVLILLPPHHLLPQHHHDTPSPAVVWMQSLRGQDAATHVVFGEPSLLVFDLTVTAEPHYVVQIVDRVGNEVLRNRATIRTGRICLLVNSIRHGSYWVRVYREANSELVAEYGLSVE